jgi:hypothetical protein|tara:strand:+ start:773 stop:1099 length:327 start_codon:yes stop_codon:yes gene_type:complete
MKNKKVNVDLVKAMKELATKSPDYQYSLIELENIMNVGLHGFGAMVKGWTDGKGFNYKWYNALIHGMFVAMWQWCEDEEDEEELRDTFKFAKYAWTNQKESMWKEEEK